MLLINLIELELEITCQGGRFKTNRSSAFLKIFKVFKNHKGDLSRNENQRAEITK